MGLVLVSAFAAVGACAKVAVAAMSRVEAAVKKFAKRAMWSIPVVRVREIRESGAGRYGNAMKESQSASFADDAFFEGVDECVKVGGLAH